MAVLYGDKQKKSTRLNRCSRDAFFAYSLFVVELPDDFGRFVVNPKTIASHIAPFREDVTPKFCADVLAEFVREGLVFTWELDGQVLGQFYNFAPRGNRFHRTPEPPVEIQEAARGDVGAVHVEHSVTCLSGAIHQSRSWGQLEEAERLSLLLKEIRRREANKLGLRLENPGRTPPKGPPKEPPKEGGTPFPSVPSVPSGTDYGIPPLPPQAGGLVENPPGEDRATTEHRRVRDRFAQVIARCRERGVVLSADDQRHVRRRLRGGTPVEDILAQVDSEAAETASDRSPPPDWFDTDPVPVRRGQKP